MKKILFLSLILLPLFNFAQLQTISNPETSVGVLIKITPPLANFSPDPNWINEIVRNEDGRIGEDLTNIEHRIFHPNAIPKPKIKDPVIQDYFGIKRKSRATNILQNFNGHPNT
ncbi:MAG: hypothetical protein KA275_05570, partial [Chitinophagaceae bacterium]|nr:hypothetical protein [Chitinophagaceae bacterium]